MDIRKQFESEFMQFMIDEGATFTSHDYKKSIVRGLKILFKYRDLFNNKDSMMDSYYFIRDKIIANNPNVFLEDFTDEFVAIFIEAYPMPDFWTASLKDFQNHVNFEKFF